VEENIINSIFSNYVITKTKDNYDNNVITVKDDLWEMAIPLYSEHRNFRDAVFYLVNKDEDKNEDEYILLKRFATNSYDKKRIDIINEFERIVNSIKGIKKTLHDRKLIYLNITERFDAKNVVYTPVKIGSMITTEDGTFCFSDYFVIYKKGEFYVNDGNPHIFLTYEQLEKEVQRRIFERMYE
jgi:hypothetical protein